MEHIQKVVYRCVYTLLALDAVVDERQCITMGALLNQSMFLILIGLMKGKTVALIVQDFRNVGGRELSS